MVIALVYDRWGNHYCFPKGLFNQKSAGVGTQSLILQVRAPENGMKQSKPPLSGRGAHRVSQGETWGSGAMTGRRVQTGHGPPAPGRH